MKSDQEQMRKKAKEKFRLLGLGTEDHQSRRLHQESKKEIECKKGQDWESIIGALGRGKALHTLGMVRRHEEGRGRATWALTSGGDENWMRSRKVVSPCSSCTV